MIDGDGNIRRWQHPTNGREQWSVRIVGASQPFLQWIQEAAERLWGVAGGLYIRAAQSERHHPLYILKFGKIAAKVMLAECYYPDALALERKRKLATECMRVSVGWSKSKTVRDPERWQAWDYVHAYPRHPHPKHFQGGGIDPTAGFAAEDILFSWAGVAKLAKARGLKPCVPKGACGFDSHPRHC